MSRLTRRYERGLSWIVSHLWWTSLGILLICVIGVLPLALSLVKFDAFPQDVGRRLFMPYHIDGQQSLERMEATVDTIEEYLYGRQEEFNIRSVYSYYDLERAESTILLTEEDDATLSTREIIERIEAIPAIRNVMPNQFLADGAVLMVEANPMSLRIANAGDTTVMPWERKSQMEDLRFTAFAASTPQVRADRNGKTGILYYT